MSERTPFSDRFEAGVMHDLGSWMGVHLPPAWRMIHGDIVPPRRWHATRTRVAEIDRGHWITVAGDESAEGASPKNWNGVPLHLNLESLWGTCPENTAPSVAYSLGTMVIATTLPELGPERPEMHDEPLILIMRVGKNPLHVVSGGYSMEEKTFTSRDAWMHGDGNVQPQPVKALKGSFPRAVLL